MTTRFVNTGELSPRSTIAPPQCNSRARVWIIILPVFSTLFSLSALPSAFLPLLKRQPSMHEVHTDAHRSPVRDIWWAEYTYVRNSNSIPRVAVWKLVLSVCYHPLCRTLWCQLLLLCWCLLFCIEKKGAASSLRCCRLSFRMELNEGWPARSRRLKPISVIESSSSPGQ